VVEDPVTFASSASHLLTSATGKDVQLGQ